MSTFRTISKMNGHYVVIETFARTAASTLSNDCGDVKYWTGVSPLRVANCNARTFVYTGVSSRDSLFFLLHFRHVFWKAIRSILSRNDADGWVRIWQLLNDTFLLY